MKKLEFVSRFKNLMPDMCHQFVSNKEPQKHGVRFIQVSHNGKEKFYANTFSTMHQSYTIKDIRRCVTRFISLPIQNANIKYEGKISALGWID